MTSPRRWSPEVRARAVPMVVEHRGERAAEGAAIGWIAAKSGGTAATPRGWVRQAERDQGLRAGPTTAERERIRSVEREGRERRRAHATRGTASAYGAPAALDRRSEP